MRMPSLALKAAALNFFDLHLRKDKATAAELVPLTTSGRSAAIQPPVPKSEDKHVGKPKFTT